MDFKCKVALVTGGSRGIGKAICKALLQRGAKVSIIDMNDETGQVTKMEFQNEFGAENVRFTKCDVTNQAEMQDAFLSTKDSFGRIDIVCNDAGIVNEDAWELMIDVNLKGIIRGTNLAIEHMHPDNGGRGGVIINMASQAGLTPISICPVYAASKHGVIGYTRSMAGKRSLINAGIRLNSICPGAVKTDMGTDKTFDVQISDFLSPDDVAEGVIQLMEDPTLNGAIMYIAAPTGIRYITMPELVDPLNYE